MKVYSYLRFSSHAQATGDSLRRQASAASRWCEVNGYGLDDQLTFRDLGVSAYDRSNVEKGALSLFIQAVEVGKVPKDSILLVESLDRLSRAALPDAIGLLMQLVKSGIEVVTLIDGKRWNRETIKNLTDFILSVVLFSRAHEESETKSLRIREKYKAKRERGEKIICSVGPGWLVKDNERKCWVAAPELTKIILRIFEYYVEGEGIAAIARRANTERWPVPSSSKKNSGWHLSLVRRILKNRAVVGEYVQRNGEVIADFFPQVVPLELFSRAQAVGSTRAAIPRRRDSGCRNIFQGMLHCGSCGASFVLKNKARRLPTSKKTYSVYMCADRVRGKTVCPTWPNGNSLQAAMLPQIFSHIAKHVTDEAAIKTAREEKESAEALLADVKERLNRLMVLAESSDSPPTGILKRLSSLEEEQANAEEAVVTATNGLVDVESAGLDFDQVDDAGKKAVDSLTGTPEDRERVRLVLLKNIERVYVFPQREVASVILRRESYARWLPLSEAANVVSPPSLPTEPFAQYLNAECDKAQGNFLKLPLLAKKLHAFINLTNHVSNGGFWWYFEKFQKDGRKRGKHEFEFAIACLDDMGLTEMAKVAKCEFERFVPGGKFDRMAARDRGLDSNFSRSCDAEVTGPLLNRMLKNSMSD